MLQLETPRGGGRKVSLVTAPDAAHAAPIGQVGMQVGMGRIFTEWGQN
jgi:hypothetical protein